MTASEKLLKMKQFKSFCPTHACTIPDVEMGLVADGDHVPPRIDLALESSRQSHHHVPLLGRPGPGLSPEMEQALQRDQWHFLPSESGSEGNQHETHSVLHLPPLGF